MSLSPILTSAAFAPIPNVGWIRITGSDRVRWLNGMVTNSIQSLKPGEGCYNFFLNAQGRIQGDATAWMLDDAIMLETAADRIPALITMLDHFIIMDDVELNLLAERYGLLLVGPQAATHLQSLSSFRAAGGPAFLSSSGLTLSLSTSLDIIHAHSPLVPRYELWGELDTIAKLSATLIGGDLAHATPEDLEQLRILEGTPLYGIDIRDKDLPQETNQTRALHFTKGCYLGQEIVERIRSRGNVHRTFFGFTLHGELPAPGTILYDQDKPVGELTSVTSLSSQLVAHNSNLFDTCLPSSPQTNIQLALGYIRREALESSKARGSTITYPGGIATPSALPFQLPESRA